MIKNYIKAARLRTLPLSVSGIIVGSFLANFSTYTNDNFPNSEKNYLIFILAILTTIGFQVLSNFANDYGDGIKGTDDNREGEARMVSSGAITPKQMKMAMIITGVITLIIALLLIYVSFGKDNFLFSVIFFGLGVSSIVAAIKYTVGKSAYGYSGFGDVFVFLFFGLLAVVGTYFLYTKQLNVTIFLPAITVGLLSTAVLNLNNMRDRVNDAKVGKNTLVVKLGASLSKYYHYYLIIASFLFANLYVVINFKSPLQFLFILAYLPIIKHLFFVYKNKEEPLLDGELKKVALSTFFFAILFGLGNIL
ncbi:1,4-dihydroxy-2-naphthoate octaprenyltransferase [Tenacibaculum dicentrarchi]|uniref:1,4-dihydroxy-2-naphthoate octaprenyltransferase n=1 Tax=Tenacibaculum dicentrarchi TaxID=669041 RepID=A0ABP1EGN5_9FLAO|nr:1,4-dihydroxy-2-naphthoate octaprenyltransferase [Tenacibaculum dicentrarchi]MCD8449054.1 1,4-dihydroxy-2-naphthoate octaprenyltransferase [Tenacibaculum dicentrarchi]MCG8837725.1 1,4-dihydroxy-2-naphthoate octaprenyltransferase [Tenacibaculum dicentrarchi]MDB0615406.1 1,4-dihydroxy-2-naphthoate octaprenyltransferase [Tenacibaculum dicentrarchi]SOS54406.1 1,4-dihydroxy-2-naphthoate octaprenyltransferase [Tenacibaculum dicentrarchi]